MKVGELRNKLAGLDPDMPVFCTSNTDEYEYGIVNTARRAYLRIDGVNNPEKDDDETEVFLLDEE